MIIHEGYNKVIYIHIPRCAGRHVTAYFKNHHITESNYDTFIDEHFEQAHAKIDYYKDYNYKNFTVVRNPFDRFESTLKRCLPYCNLSLNTFENVKDYDTFLKYLNLMKNTKSLGQFFEKQINFINKDTYIWKLEDSLGDNFLRWLKDNFDQFNIGYGGNDKVNPFGLEVVNTGGCHTRAYGVQDWQWQILMNYQSSKEDVIQAHKKYYTWCKDSQDTMATVIDQAKYLDEVQMYWTDVEDSILVGEDNLSTNLAVISEDRLQKLKDMASSRKSKNSDVVLTVNENQQHLS